MAAITTPMTIQTQDDRPELEDTEVDVKLTEPGEGLAPLTVTVPDDGLEVYPTTAPTVNSCVPFGSVNVIELPVPLCVAPLSVTDHVVPLGSLLSVNVTEYCPGGSAANVTACVTAAPATRTLPDNGVVV